MQMLACVLNVSAGIISYACILLARYVHAHNRPVRLRRLQQALQTTRALPLAHTCQKACTCQGHSVDSNEVRNGQTQRHTCSSVPDRHSAIGLNHWPLLHSASPSWCKSILLQPLDWQHCQWWPSTYPKCHVKITNDTSATQWRPSILTDCNCSLPQCYEVRWSFQVHTWISALSCNVKHMNNFILTPARNNLRTYRTARRNFRDLHEIVAIRTCSNLCAMEMWDTCSARICINSGWIILQVGQTVRIYASPTYAGLCSAKAAKFSGYAVQCRMFLAQIRKNLLQYISARFNKCGFVQKCMYADPGSPKHVEL